MRLQYVERVKRSSFNILLLLNLFFGVRDAIDTTYSLENVFGKKLWPIKIKLDNHYWNRTLLLLGLGADEFFYEAHNEKELKEIAVAKTICFKHSSSTSFKAHFILQGKATGILITFYQSSMLQIN